MNSPATDSPIARRNMRRQFNLRTLFEITTGVAILTPAFQYVQRDSNRDTLVLTLLLLGCGLSMLGACWLFVRRCPASRAGRLLAILFCMSTFNGFLLGGFALFHEVDQIADVGMTITRFALMWIVGSLVSFLYACMISLVLLAPAAMATLVVRTWLPTALPTVSGALTGLLTGALAALGWRLFWPETAYAAPLLHMLLATVYGGYLGGRLIEQRPAGVFVKAATTGLN